MFGLEEDFHDPMVLDQSSELVDRGRQWQRDDSS
jgi:hypothetical protein